ncbi:MAG: hypothetical protein H6721_05870 [Sandaracinus sp.]|nr:hypothetical protein [Sandaracinus sp.]
MRASFGVLVGLSCVLPAVVGCGDDGGGFVVDAEVPDGSMRPPPYRPPRCGGDAGVGDGGCGEGGVPVEEDAGMPDAGPPPPPCNEHTFEYVNATATTVWVAGSFNLRPDGNWASTLAEGVLELERMGDTWTLTTLIEPIEPHQYKFIVDGTTWIADPANPNRVDDGFGGFNSVLDVCAAACGELGEFDWRDTFMYFVMVDRFRDGDGMANPVAGATDGDATTGPSGQYEGGDLRGITNQMDYLSDLGVTALWITAPFENRNQAGAAINPASDPNTYSAFHGYWPSPANIDYSGATPSPRPLVESRIGNEADLRAMIAAAHGATSANGDGIKVLFDYVMNHVDVASGLYTAHNDWFVRRGDGSRPLCGPENLWDDPYWGTRCAFTDYLPAFDFEGSPAARAWSVADALWWAKEFDIDGYRLDAIKHVPLSWLTDLRARLNAEITDAPGDRFYLVGETFAYDNRERLRSYVGPRRARRAVRLPVQERGSARRSSPTGNLGAFGVDGRQRQLHGPGSIMTTWIGNPTSASIHFASRESRTAVLRLEPGNWLELAAEPAPPGRKLTNDYGRLMRDRSRTPASADVYCGDGSGSRAAVTPIAGARMMPPWTELAEQRAPARASPREVRALSQIRGAHPVLGRGRRVTVSSDADTWVTG